jgi:hypothetical protein
MTKNSNKTTPSNNGANWNGRRSANADKKQDRDVVSVTYEEIGLFPRSFSRVLDRFLKQVFSDVGNLVIQEYRFYRYLFLTTVRCLCILFFVPFLVNYCAKNYLIHPLTEYFWNSKQSEIFLNSYQQKRAFAELKEFEEKLYFESFIHSNSQRSLTPASTFQFTNNTMNTSFGTTNSFNSIEKAEVGERQLSQMSSPLSTVKMNIAEMGNSGGTFKTLTDKNTIETPISTSILSTNSNTRGAANADFEKERNTNNNTYSSALSVRSEEKADKATNQRDYIINLNPSLSSPFLNTKGNYNSDFSKTSETNQFISLLEVHKQRLQEKTVEIAIRYNNQSIDAITNFFADLLSFLTLFYLLYALEIQINITKSFLLEVFFGLDDSKKSLLILLVTDLLVGYHSSNLWELFFEFLFNHYGLPESQTGIFLLVATLPVLLDVLFKYLIFRHLNRSSPATVATYHAMIE